MTTTRGFILSQFDFFDIQEVRLASTFLVLSKIFRNMSDEVDDKWQVKADEYFAKYKDMIRLARISLDLNDDGHQSGSETLKGFITRRLLR